MLQIKLSNQARKSLKKLDKNYLIKISRSIDLLTTNPFLGEKMAGNFQDCYRIKIPPVRIIYILDLKNKVIIIRAIGHRQGIYKE